MSDTSYADKTVIQQADDWQDSEKAKAAKIFYGYYVKAKNTEQYLALKKQHINNSL